MRTQIKRTMLTVSTFYCIIKTTEHTTLLAEHSALADQSLSQISCIMSKIQQNV